MTTSRDRDHTFSLPKQGEHVCGAELLRRAWMGDAEGIEPGGLYRRSAQAVGRPSAVLGAGGRRYWFARVESKLTPRQRRILDWICQFDANRGWMPTIREIGAAFGINSTNAVADHLKALERKGYIRREPMGSRTLTILRDANERDCSEVDWRARALAAEAEVARLVALLDAKAAA